jgi:hypothetical protein
LEKKYIISGERKTKSKDWTLANEEPKLENIIGLEAKKDPKNPSIQGM